MRAAHSSSSTSVCQKTLGYNISNAWPWISTENLPSHRTQTPEDRELLLHTVQCTGEYSDAEEYW